jgi:hypothetical protein
VRGGGRKTVREEGETMRRGEREVRERQSERREKIVR